MPRHFYLAQASNFSARQTLRHLFAFGGSWDSVALRGHLAERYHTDLNCVALYGTGRSALAAALKVVLAQGTAGGKAAAAGSASSEVVITALTCYAVVEAVRAAGATPVFADVDPVTLHFGAKELEAVLKTHKHVKAVVVQNNLGVPADIVGIEKCCKKHNIPIIEDLAHCAGVRYPDGREAGTVGVAAALSFGKGKSIDTISGGALVLSKSLGVEARQPLKKPAAADTLRARWYPVFGAIMRGLSYVHLTKYFTALLLKLHFIERSADAKLSLSTRCTHWQARLALSQFLSLPDSRPPIRTSYRIYRREEALDKLEKHGFIFNDTWYDIPVSPLRYYKKADFPEKSCPVAMQISQELINFPTHYRKKALRPAEKLIEEYRK